MGHGTIAVTERYGTIGDDLVEREAMRLAQRRAQGANRRKTGQETGQLSMVPELSWCAALESNQEPTD
jgi:hypothetical protein